MSKIGATTSAENSPVLAPESPLPTGRPWTIQQGVLKNPRTADTGTGLARPLSLMRGTGLFLTFLVAAALPACSVVSNPTQPGGGSSTTGPVVYSALGASDANGVGSTTPCLPYADCPNGTGYVQVIARRYSRQCAELHGHFTPRELATPLDVRGKFTGRTVKASLRYNF